MDDRPLFLLALGRKKPGFGAIVRLDCSWYDSDWVEGIRREYSSSDCMD